MKTIRKYLFMLFALAVTLTATAQTANKLSVGQVQLEPNTSIALPFSLDNNSEIVAMQFDLTVPQGVTLNTSSLAFSERKADHKAVVKKKNGTNIYTFMVYSPSNAAIQGNEGEVFNIQLSIDNSLTLGTVNPLSLSSVVLSMRNGSNVVTAVQDGSVQAITFITITAAACEHGHIEGAGIYVAGLPVTLTAVPDPTYHLLQWEDGSNETVRVVTPQTDMEVSATFSRDRFSLTVLASDPVMGSVSGNGVYDYEQQVNIKAQANTGYHFVEWSDGNKNAERIYVMGYENVTLTAQFAPNQYKISVSSLNTQMGTVAGGGSFDFATEHEITATAKEGYHFVAWNDANEQNPRKVMVIAEDQSFTASFAPNKYTIAVSSSNDEMGKVSGAGEFDYKANVQIAAQPETGYRFLQWNDGDKSNPRTVQVPVGGKSFVAQFGPAEYVINVLSSNAEMGLATGGGVFPFKSEIEISATANEGYHFVKWNDNNEENPRSITVGAKDEDFTAIFAPNKYIINVSPEDAEMGSVTGSGPYDYKSNVQVEAIPEEGYHFVAWSDQNQDNPRTINVPLNGLSLTASFAPNEYNITVKSANNELGTATGGGKYLFKSSVQISATATDGYHFVAWGDGNKDNPRTIIVGAKNATYTASFAPNIYHIEALSADLEMGTTSGSGDYEYKSTAILNATANTGYHFTKWADEILTARREVFVGIGDASFTAEFDYNEYNITVLSADEKMGGVSGTGLYKFKSEVTISANAIEGYHFVAWNDENQENPRKVVVGAKDETFTATFAPNQYIVSAEPADAEMGSVTGGGLFDYKSDVKIEATAKTGYHFVGWSDQSTENPRTINVPLNGIELKAIFDYNEYNITVLSADEKMGGVSGTGVYKFKSEVTISALPIEGYHFVAWNDENQESPRKVVVGAKDETFTATFAPNQYIVSAEPADAEMGSVTGGGLFDYKSNVQIEATAKTGYHFVSWSDQSTENPRTINVPLNGIELKAVFDYNEYNITVLSADEKMGGVEGTGVYKFKSEVTISALPIEGYHFVAWNDENQENPRKVVVGAEDKTFTATFAPNQYMVSAEAADAEMGSVTGGGLFDYKSDVKIEASAKTGYHFVSWSDQNQENPRTINVPLNGIELKAIFDYNEYNITVLSADEKMGGVSGTGVYKFKDEVTIAANAIEGYHFVAWNDENQESPRKVVVGASDATYTATFAPNQYMVSAESADAEMGTVTGGGLFDYKSNVQIEATAKTGYHFVSWSDQSTENPRTVNVPLGGIELQAIFDYNEYNITVLSVDEKMGGVSGTGVYKFKSEVTISALPIEGYHFVAWNDENQESPRKVVVGAEDKTFTATFAPNQYMVSAEAADAEMGSVTGGGLFDYKSNVQIEATAKTGYHFVSWSDQSTENPRTINVPLNGIELKAVFDYNEYNITVLSADEKMGGVEGTGVYKFKSEVTISALPIEGYHFVAWNDNNESNPRTVKVGAEDVTYTATFAPNQYMVSAESADAEMGTVTGGGLFDYKSNVQIEATAKTGYHFVSWSDQSTENPRTVNVPLGGIELKAVFDYNEYNITVLSANAEMGAVSGTGLYKFKSDVEIVANPIEGYHFVAWNDNNETNPRTIKVGAKDETFTATFAPNQYIVSVEAADAEMGSVSGGGLFDYKSNVKIEATANTGYHFVGWSDQSTENPRTINVSLNGIELKAIFDYNEYNITVLSADEKMGGVSGTGLYKFKDEVTISANAIEGYHFVAWNDANQENPRKVVVGAKDETFTATFAPNQYMVSAEPADAEMGSVTGGGLFDYKSNVQIEATAKTGYHFVGWSDQNQENPRTINVPLNGIELKAIFDYNEYNITVLSADEKMGGVEGTGVYKFKSEVTISALPIEGYHFVAWNDENQESSRKVVVGAEDKTFTATFAPNQYAVVVTSADAEKGSVTGGGLFDYKSDVQIEATAKPGHHFVGWSDLNQENPRTINVPLGGIELKAIFDHDEYNITVVSSDEKMGSVTGTGLYPFNSNVEISATAIEGYHFVAWNDNDESNPRTVKVGAEDATYTATFALNQYAVVVTSADAEMGSVTGGGVFNYKSYVTIKATANTGYHFVSWSDNVAENPRLINVPLNGIELKAIFDYNEYNINVLSANAEMGGVEGTGVYKFKDEVTISALPIEGYHFVAWNDENQENPRKVVVGAEDKTFTATFAPNQYMVSAEAADAEMGSVTGGGLFDYKSDVKIEATAKTGYHFVGWSDQNQENPRTINVPLNGIELKAIFDYNEYNITVLSADEKMGGVSGTGLYKFKDEVTISANAIEGYHFVAWNDGNEQAERTIVVGAEDATYTATFAANKYIVTFVDYDGETVLATDEVEFGKGATAPSDPQRAGFTFIGWDKPFDKVTENMVITAQYEENPVDYTPHNLTVELSDVAGDTKVDFRWDKVEGVALYAVRLGYGDELSDPLPTPMNSLSLLLSMIEKQYRIDPGTYTIDWYVICLDAAQNPLCDWTQGQSFEITIKGEGTDLDAVQTNQSQGRKVLINGKVYIERNSVLYDAAGKQVR